MPVRPASAKHLNKLSANHRRFAQLLAAGVKQMDAFAAAGFAVGAKSSSRECERLAAQPLIQALKQQIEAENRIRLNVSVESLILELEDARLQAISLDRPGDAVKAIEGKAKVLGLMRERDVQISIIAKPALEPGAPIELSIEEWQRQWSPKPLPAPSAVNGRNGNGHG